MGAAPQQGQVEVGHRQVKGPGGLTYRRPAQDGGDLRQGGSPSEEVLQIAQAHLHQLGLSGAARGKDLIGDAVRVIGERAGQSGGKALLRPLPVQQNRTRLLQQFPLSRRGQQRVQGQIGPPRQQAGHKGHRHPDLTRVPDESHRAGPLCPQFGRQALGHGPQFSPADDLLPCHQGRPVSQGGAVGLDSFQQHSGLLSAL